MAGSLTLIANPGSASRKYGLYAAEQPRGHIHVEHLAGRAVAHLTVHGHSTAIETDLSGLTDAPLHIADWFREHNLLHTGETIGQIGLRVVAPGSFFLQDHVVEQKVIDQLESLLPRAPLHITATLSELHALRREFGQATMVAVSDSAFHSSKPAAAWYYGLPLADADRLDIKRFGYHGLSVESAVQSLQRGPGLPAKLVVCHLGSGASVSAVLNGRSQDTTMGYSPLEGVIMSTRVGNIDPTAVRIAKEALQLDDNGIESYLNHQSGLLGLGGSADIRELLDRQARGDQQAALALEIYILNLQKAVAQMVAVLGGIDMLVLTGTVGERSAPIRQRLVAKLHYLGLDLAEPQPEPAGGMTSLQVPKSKPILIIPADESHIMVHHVSQLCLAA